MQPLADRPPRESSYRTLVATYFVAVVLIVSIAAALVGSSAASALSSPAGSPAAALGTSSGAGSSPPSGAIHPSVDQVQGVFFDTNSTFAPPNSESNACAPYNFYSNTTSELYAYHQQTCANGPQNPSTVSFGGNSLGVLYSSVTNETPTASCPGASDLVTSGVYFQTSNNSGANWNTSVGIANATCDYLQAFDPSAAIADDVVYAAFIESNISNATSPIIPTEDNLSEDAIGFTWSTDNGTTFAPVVTLTAAGLNNRSDPVVAAIGDTVYVAYVNTANWTNLTLPVSSYTNLPYYPTSINIIYSSNSGATWSSPVTLPGINPADGYSADGPSLAVNSLGELAVSYATNWSCVLISGSCYDYGAGIFVTTSSTNGTTWSSPVTITPLAGAYGCQYEDPLSYYCLPGPDQGPHSAIAFDPGNPAQVYVVYTASYYTWNTTTSGEGGSTTTTNIGYGEAVFDAVSSNAGVRWHEYIVERTTSSSGDSQDWVLNPTVTVSASGEVYVAFDWLNLTECGGCNGAFFEYTSYWEGSSSDGGVTWNLYPTLLTDIYFFYMFEDWFGLTSAVTVTTAGPVAIYSEGLGYTYLYNEIYNSSGAIPTLTVWENYTYPTELLAAFPSQGTPVAVNFTASGLPTNSTRWSFSLSGNTWNSTSPTIQVTDIPVDVVLYYESGAVPVAYWTEYQASSSIGDEISFFGPTNVTLSYYLCYGVAYYLAPIAPGATTGSGYALSDIYFEIYTDLDGVFVYWDTYSQYQAGIWYNGTEASETFPWYYPANSTIQLSTDIDTDLPMAYIYGNGNGSSTGFFNGLTATVDGPINETYVAGVIGSYSISFTPKGLPAGSTYSFIFDGTSYSGTAPSPVSVGSVLTGSYTVSGVSATSTTPGYVYYAPDTPSVIIVPLTTDVVLNFSTDVDTTGALGVVSFQAVGLTTGSFWQLAFNGTTYGSTTPWINVTTHSGTFGVASLPISASANETTAYTANSFGPSLAVSPGTTYPVTFSLSYRTDVSASIGGTVTGAGTHWLAPGSTASYLATALGGDSFLGWSGNGSGSYSGPSPYANITVNAPITETASFAGLPADRFNLTLTENGLPAGTWWTVSLNSIGYSSNAATFQVSDLYSCSDGASGQYPLSVPFVYLNGTAGVRYVATGYPTTTCTDGVTSVVISFHVEYLVTAFSWSGGSAVVELRGAPASSGEWVSSGTAVSIVATPNAGYMFNGWVGSGPANYTGPVASEVILPAGAVSEVATFGLTPAPYVPVVYANFTLGSTLLPGTTWSVTFNDITYATTSSSINITGLAPAPYSFSLGTVYSPDRSVEYTPHLNPSAPSPFDLSHNTSFRVDYSSSYWVSIATSAGGTVSPVQSAYYATGSVVALVATPAIGDSFVGWLGAGAGSFTGTSPSANVTISGAITETASFAPTPASSSSPSFLASTAGVAVLAIVGLVVGLVVGVVLFRRGPPRSPPPSDGSSGESP